MPVLISCIISIILGVIGTNILSDKQISLSIFTCVVIILTFIIWFLILVIIKKIDTSSDMQINLIKFVHKPNDLFCLLSECNFLSINSFVTIFYLNDDLETYFATGLITNVQKNNIIQVKIIHFNEHLENDEINSAINNNVTFLNTLIVKPIVTNNYFKE